MRKLFIAIYKELLLLINDKIGLAMMFFLPVLLVIIVTVIQNSAVKIVNENSISIYVFDNDNSNVSNDLINEIKKSGMFSVKCILLNSNYDLKKIVYQQAEFPFGIYIPKNFGKKVNEFCKSKVDWMLNEISGQESNSNNFNKKNELITLYFNPIVQKNFYESISQVVNTLIIKTQTKYFMKELNSTLGLKKDLLSQLSWNEKKLDVQISGESKGSNKLPNVSQHNVPAWSIFAIFFMVVSVAGNFVRERNNGAFDRILTMPTNFSIILSSKVILFTLISLIQISVIFCISYFVFPFLSLPILEFPKRIDTLLVAVIFCGLTAVLYSLLIGTYSKTVEQANGFGALSVIIFAILGGIWVPFYILPDYFKIIGKFSPLYWCMECFYTIFLKNAKWNEMYIPILILLLMNICFILLISIKLYRLGYLKKR